MIANLFVLRTAPATGSRLYHDAIIDHYEVSHHLLLVPDLRVHVALARLDDLDDHLCDLADRGY